MHEPWRGRLLALAAGLLYPTAFAPLAWWPLILLSIAVLWWTLQNRRPHEALLRGWLFGMGLFGYGTSWLYVSMHDYGFTPIWMAVPLTGLFAAGMALYPALMSWLCVRLGGSALTFAGLWVLTDWLRGWLFTGFPWLYPGYALVDTPLANLAPVGGIWLVTLGTVLTALLLAQLVVTWRRALPLVVLTALCWAAGTLLSPTIWVHPQKHHPVPVALIQGNIPQDLKWQLTMRQRTQDIYKTLSSDIPDHHLVVWPESAIPEFYQDARDFLDHEGKMQADNGGALIAGVPWRTLEGGSRHYYNSVAVLGGGEGVYNKQRLVPFGEYVPMESLLRGLIPFFNLPMSSFTPGKPGQKNLKAMGMTVSPFVCYEILYPALVARRSRGSQVLLTVSDDAWFGTSAGPHQHFQMSRMRALETGRWLLSDTNNGISAVIDPHGRIVKRAPQFVRTVLYSHFQPVSGATPFMRLGSPPVLILSLILTVAGWWTGRRRTA